LTASEEATQDVIVEAVTEEATEVAQIATEAPTERPTAAFTLQALEIASFQARQQDELEAELAALEAQRPEGGEEEFLGTYPIRLAIEDLGLISPVLQVQTDANFDIVTPRDEIGHYVLSERLGTGGNTVMVGHVYPGRVFNVLLDAEIGQVVRVTDENFEEHYYQITEIIRFPYEIGNAEDRELGLHYMHDNSEERITLVTCYPEFEWTHRFVVRAVPIDGPPEPVDDNGDGDSGELPPIDFDLDN
jgi:LPXTG-site transpeptidase (sortase) family protein